MTCGLGLALGLVDFFSELGPVHQELGLVKIFFPELGLVVGLVIKAKFTTLLLTMKELSQGI